LRTRLANVLASAIAVLVFSTLLHAHHGASMFDMKNLITTKGIVTSFEWINPHAMIFADAKDDKAGVQEWAIETRGGPNLLTKAGWTKDTLRPGDQVTFIGHPAKDGAYKMRLAKIVLASGQELDPESHSWY